MENNFPVKYMRSRTRTAMMWVISRKKNQNNNINERLSRKLGCSLKRRKMNKMVTGKLPYKPVS